jgi:hypothetical protein
MSLPNCLVLSALHSEGSDAARKVAIAERYIVGEVLRGRYLPIAREPGQALGMTRLAEMLGQADIVVAIQIGIDPELERGLGAAMISGKLICVLQDEIERTPVLHDHRDIGFNIDPISHDIARDRLRALLPAVQGEHARPKPKAGQAQAQDPDRERSQKEIEMDAATKLIELLMGREGFSRIAFDNRQGRRLVIYGDQSLDTGGVEGEIDGVPVEFRLN